VCDNHKIINAVWDELEKVNKVFFESYMKSKRREDNVPEIKDNS
jgi:hypothetical protein